MAESFVERRAAGRRTPSRIQHATVDDPKVSPLRRERGRAIIARSGRTRDVITAFDNHGALQEAVKALESNGFDRSQIRLLATREALEHDLADCFALPGGQVADRVVQPSLGRVAAPNVFGMMVTPAAATFRLAQGPRPDGALAAVAASTLAATQEAPPGWPFRDDMAVHLQEQISRGRILVWVSLTRPEREATAREILARHAQDVRAYMS